MQSFEDMHSNVWMELCERYDLKYLVLFGSRIHRATDALSDWDFGAKFSRRPSLREFMDLLRELMDIVDSDNVDLVVINDPLPPALLFEILWRGTALCVRDTDEYHWDRVRALALYHEYNLVFKPSILKSVIDYG